MLANVPNTAINIGWGWGKEPSYSKNNRIGLNCIHEFSRLFHDSAAIYTFGPMRYTTVYSNYIRNGGQGYACLYPDEGSAYQTWTRNVCQGVSEWLHIWAGSIHDDRIIGNWSDTPAVTNRGANILAGNTVISNGEWPAAALQVMEAAGIVK